MSRSVDSSAERVVMAEISGDGSKLTDITLEQITQYGAITTRNITIRNVVTDGTTFGVSNTNPTDTLSVGNTVFVKNNVKKLLVKGTLQSDAYDITAVSQTQDVLVNDGGLMVGANNVTHNKTSGEFNIGGRFSAGKITVSGHSSNNQLLFSNAGTLEGAPITYDITTQETTIPGKLNILGGLKVLGSISQVKVENVVIDDPILEISSNSEDNTTSGIVIQRPSGNVAISYQNDNTFNLAYTTGSAYGTDIDIDTSRSLPMKIHGTLRVLKGIDIQDKAQNNQLLYSNAGVLEGAPITYNSSSNITHIATNLTFGKLNVAAHSQDTQLLYSNAGVLEGAAISYNPVTDRTLIAGSLEVTGGIVGDISGGVSIDAGNNQEILYNDNGAVSGSTMTFNKLNNQTTFTNIVNVTQINFL